MTLWKIGWHGAGVGHYNGFEEWRQSLAQGGRRLIFQQTDADGEVGTLQNMNANAVLVFRRTGNLENLPYSGDPEQFAQQRMAALANLWPAALNPAVVWTCSTNEPSKEPEHMEWLARYELQCAHEALRLGRRYLAFGWSGGTPEPDWWENPWSLALLQLCADNPTRLGIRLHEYSFTDDIRDDSPYLVGRFQFLHDICDNHTLARPTIVIGECGWHYDRIPLTPNQFADQLNWLQALYGPHPNILGAAIWTLGTFSGTVVQDAIRLLPTLIDTALDHIHEPPPDPDPPTPVPNRGAPRIQYARLYNVIPAHYDIDQATAVFRAGWTAGKQSAGGSYDDAGVGDLNQRTAVLHGIPTNDQQLFLDWYAHHYPGVVVGFADQTPAPTFTFTNWPTDYRHVTQRFGNNPAYYARYGLPGHEGVDIRAPHGSPVYAAAAGQVSDLRQQASGHNYGRFVRIAHSNGYESTYAHLHQINVTLGQQITGGQVIGLADTTGNAYGSHLHLTLKRAPGDPGWPSNIVNPEPFLEFTDVTWPDPVPPTPPAHIARFGLHARADTGDLTEAEFAEFRAAKPNLIKVLSAHSGTAISRLAIEHPTAHFIVRAFLNFGERVITPVQFYNDTINDIQRAINALPGRTIYLEIHNEPNLADEGLWRSWQHGADFADWFVAVASLFRAHLPNTIRLMYPGLSPGADISGIRQHHLSFLQQSARALQAADALGAHVYWADNYPMSQALADLAQIIPFAASKPVAVTEASNNKAGPTPAQKAHDYITFWRELSRWTNVVGVTYFVVSASNPAWGWDPNIPGSAETWLENNETLGIGTAVGNR